MLLFAFLYDHLKRVSLPEVVPKVNIKSETVDMLLFEEMDNNVQPLEEEELLDKQMAVENIKWQHNVQKHRLHSQPSLFHFGLSKRQSTDSKHEEYYFW